MPTSAPRQSGEVDDQRPLISTCSTSEAVAAWIGRSADRAGPTPTPSNGTGGDPDDVPGPHDQVR